MGGSDFPAGIGLRHRCAVQRLSWWGPWPPGAGSGGTGL